MKKLLILFLMLFAFFGTPAFAVTLDYSSVVYPVVTKTGTNTFTFPSTVTSPMSFGYVGTGQTYPDTGTPWYKFGLTDTCATTGSGNGTTYTVTLPSNIYSTGCVNGDSVGGTWYFVTYAPHDETETVYDVKQAVQVTNTSGYWNPAEWQFVPPPIYRKERVATYSYQAVAADHDITDGGIGMLYTPTTDKPVQAIESVSFYLWRNASSSSDLEAKVYKVGTDTPLVTSATVAGSTVTFNDNYDPLTGHEGGWVKFTFATPVVLKGGDDYAIVVHNNDGEDYHLIGTATGDGYSAENKCKYISDVSPLTLTDCSGSNESVNVRLEFTPIVMGSPLSSAPTIGGGYHFGDTWTEGECPTGVPKIHTGSDFTTGGESGATVYATEAGDVVGVINPNNGWAKAVVIQHTNPNGWHYTTVTWHIDTTLAVTNPLTTVEKGDAIGTVANINVSPYYYTPHLHFGVQMGTDTSGYGALPVDDCSTWSAFPNGFIDTNDSKSIICSCSFTRIPLWESSFLFLLTKHNLWRLFLNKSESGCYLFKCF